IDLDPGDDVGWPAIVDAAKLVKHLLSVLDLASFVKTTGGRGIHVVVPLVPHADWTDCLEFARTFAQALVRRQPALFTERFAKAGRDDKILIDYLRNNRTNTSIAAFSTRAKPDAPVSVSLTWAELRGLQTPARFTIDTVPNRLGRMKADPWKDYWTTRQRLPAGGVRPTVAALATLAWDPRRATFFRGELFDALEILNRGDIDLGQLRGSWAGAMGQVQFMPSSYLKYAEDFDGDGHRDIWSTPGDVF